MYKIADFLYVPQGFAHYFVSKRLDIFYKIKTGHENTKGTGFFVQIPYFCTKKPVPFV